MVPTLTLCLSVASRLSCMLLEYHEKMYCSVCLNMVQEQMLWITMGKRHLTWPERGSYGNGFMVVKDKLAQPRVPTAQCEVQKLSQPLVNRTPRPASTAKIFMILVIVQRTRDLIRSSYSSESVDHMAGPCP